MLLYYEIFKNPVTALANSNFAKDLTKRTIIYSTNKYFNLRKFYYYIFSDLECNKLRYVFFVSKLAGYYETCSNKQTDEERDSPIER